MQVGTGKSILNGIAIGKLKIYKKKDTVISTAQVADTAAEEARFEEARAKAIDQQTALYEKALAEAGEDIAEVFNIHAMMLDDDDFVDAIKDAQVLAFAPPMISGFSMQNGITMTMQDKTGGDLNKFFDNVKKFLAELNKRPEIQTAQTQYNPNYPQYMVDVDVAKTKQAGISPSTVLSVMQGYLGGLYASNFNAYGKLYRVMIQAGPESRMRPDDLSKIYVRCADGTMSPVSEFVNLKKVYGPSNITRFNLFTSMDVSVTPNSGYSTGDGMKAIAEVAKETLPEGYGYEYSGLTRSEAESSNSTGLIFALCIVFVYLILSAQYESYILPLSVVLSIPFGLAGSFIFTNLFGHSNDICANQRIKP